MTSESTTKLPSTKKAANGGDVGDAFLAAMHEVRGALDGVRRTVPDVARASRVAVDDLVKAMESGSDDRTQAGVTLSLGLALGMLLGRAPRILVLLALAPVAAMALVVGERRARREAAAS